MKNKAVSQLVAYKQSYQTYRTYKKALLQKINQRTISYKAPNQVCGDITHVGNIETNSPKTETKYA
jgi:NADPH-dependent 7-cyano-7-deazaguanine reductase QueF